MAPEARPWTDEEVALLRKLAPIATMPDVAAHLGRSLSQITRQARKLKVAFGTGAGKRSRASLTTAASSASAKTVARADRQRERVAAMPTVAPASVGVHLSDLRFSHCRWPMWGEATPRDERLFCGARRTRAGCAYCETHADIASGSARVRFSAEAA